MGASQHPLLVSLDLKGMVQGTEEKSNSSGSLRNKVLKAQSKKRLQGRRRRVFGKIGHVRNRRSRRILMKRRARLEGSRRPVNGMERRVRALKKLIPKDPNAQSMGLDGLFRETADYILSLQMRVQVMQIMVKVLTGSDE